MSSYKKFLIALGILLVIALGLYGASLLLVRSGINPSAETPITVIGKITCLPHKNQNGPQTLECALGLQATDNKYYGLKNLPDPTSSSTTQVEITGTLQQPTQDELYNVVGNIQVLSVTKK